MSACSFQLKGTSRASQSGLALDADGFCPYEFRRSLAGCEIRGLPDCSFTRETRSLFFGVGSPSHAPLAGHCDADRILLHDCVCGLGRQPFLHGGLIRKIKFSSGGLVCRPARPDPAVPLRNAPGSPASLLPFSSSFWHSRRGAARPLVVSSCLACGLLIETGSFPFALTAPTAILTPRHSACYQKTNRQLPRGKRL